MTFTAIVISTILFIGTSLFAQEKQNTKIVCELSSNKDSLLEIVNTVYEYESSGEIYTYENWRFEARDQSGNPITINYGDKTSTFRDYDTRFTFGEGPSYKMPNQIETSDGYIKLRISEGLFGTRRRTSFELDLEKGKGSLRNYYFVKYFRGSRTFDDVKIRFQNCKLGIQN